MSHLLEDGSTWLQYCGLDCQALMEVVSYYQGHARSVLVNRLVGLSLRRNSASEINWLVQYDIDVDGAIKLKKHEKERNNLQASGYVRKINKWSKLICRLRPQFKVSFGIKYIFKSSPIIVSYGIHVCLESTSIQLQVFCWSWKHPFEGWLNLTLVFCIIYLC